MDNHIVGFAAVFGAMFVIANPFSGLPYLLGYSSPLTKLPQKAMGALITVLTVTVAGLIVLFFGHTVLSFFGVTIPGLRVGGGVVILASGFAMMKQTVSPDSSGRSLWKVIEDLVRRGHHPETAKKQVSESSPEAKQSVASHQQELAQVTANSVSPDASKGVRSAYLSLMFPFAIPMILGPGFMSTIIIADSDNSKLTVLWAFLALMGVTLVIFLFAQPIRSLLGTFGMNVLLRLVGLVIIVLAVQIIASGLVDLLPGLAGAKK